MAAPAVETAPANEGTCATEIKKEAEDPEIAEMANKLKENYQKSALASARHNNNTVPNLYVSRSGRSVTLNIPTANQSSKDNKDDKPPKDSDAEDSLSEKGHFGWEEIGTFFVPYIFRKIKGELLKYVSVRIAETQLLTKYLHFLHADIYSCTSVKSHFITEFEGKILNDINAKHSDHLYGKDQFYAGKDYIVRLEDVKEFYAFLEVCYKKLLCNITPGRREKCGFIRINSESVVPYCIKDGQKYVPLFYFEGETENLRHRAIKLENWHLAYLKFCCKVQGIRNELFASDSCIVTSLDDIKNYFPPDTNFEEYWPAKVVDTQLLTNTKSTTVSTPGSWIRVPHPSENPHTTPAPTPAGPPPSLPLWPTPANQMVNGSSFNIQAQQLPPPSYTAVTRNTNAVAQYYASNTALVHHNNTPINNVVHAPPPPLVRAGMSIPIGNSGSYSNGPMNTMYNPTNGHTNQVRHFYGGQRSNNAGQIQQQQLMTQPQQSYGVQPLQGGSGSTSTRMTNTQQRNALRNSAVLTAPASEIIDLSSPPSSPTPQNDSTRTSSNPWTLRRIPEYVQQPQYGLQPIATPYKIQKGSLQGKHLYCINAQASNFSELMVTLDDLVESIFPTTTVATCAHVLQKYLKTTLYSGNSDQMALLREHGRLRSLYPDDTPMAMLQDITQVFLQLKSLIAKQDEQIQPYLTNGTSKRQRMS